MSTALTIDDFDPLFVYSDYTAWTTPNPQDNPTWWNESSSITGVPWHQATWHYTDVVGTSVSLNFTGTSFTLYGAIGDQSNYTITLDPHLVNPYKQAFTQTQNATDGARTVLFSVDGLNDGKHGIEIVNYAGLLIDLAVVQIDLGAQGATLTNTTVQNDDSRIQYTGDWTTQSGPNFSGGTSTFAKGPDLSFKFDFEGSALYIYGDQVNDHGYYSIYLNGTSPSDLYGMYTGRSGCGGGYAKYCEKLYGLVGFIGGLPSGQHEVVLVNQSPAEGNVTYFDFDYIQYTTPSSYLSIPGQDYSCPFTNCTNTSTSPSGTISAGNNPSGTVRPSSTISTGASASSGAALTSTSTEYISVTGFALIACVLRLFNLV